MIDPAIFAFLKDDKGERFTSWMMSLPTEWRRYTSSKQKPFREGLGKFHTIYIGYLQHREKMEKALKALFECMNNCLAVKKELVELSDKVAVNNGKPTTLPLKKWLNLHVEVRRLIKREPANALPYVIDLFCHSTITNQRILKENVSLKEENKSWKRLEEDFYKLQKRNFEIQEKRAKEVEELNCVKQELDKAKQQLDKVNKDAIRLWKEKEHYLRELRDTNINELRNQIGAEQAKVSELTKKCQVISKEKEQLLTRLSEVAGAKLKSNNPAITDLSDENRPLKLAEKFSQIYDDDWTDSLEEITKIGVDEETSISFLLRIVMTAFELCSRSQFACFDLSDCQKVIWCDENVKQHVLHEIKLSDAARLEMETKIKECRHASRKDLISTMQMRFQIILKDMVCDFVRKHYVSRPPLKKPKLNQSKVEDIEVNEGEMRKNASHADSEHSMKRTTSRSLSVECKSGINNEIPTDENWVFTKTFSSPKLGKKDEYRLTQSARGDFLKPCYENYKEEGFSLERAEIEKLFFDPMKSKTASENTLEDFPKTNHFANSCVEICWLMQLIQPPVHLSARIPENRERKQDVFKDVFKAYTKSGQIINYIVWPAMYLHKDGSLLSKGVAQPK
ncbi:uncharacterized protein LOC125678386 isoform X2 [Ostrea edulis]|uniref:uncharacterized protein LOC125678386 isoform X2 n=1 Tax=Ostrea edulis TaxID=37623 RepID=UPI0024AFA0CB|nr:uncharacterized protein LOC125678386 isoform X2 [Ostrea edulis]